jgi:TM2 domain-containing membrane protein YozV
MCRNSIERMLRFSRILLGSTETLTMLNPAYTNSLNEQQRAWFYAEYQAAAKDEVVGVLLALFLGNFGVHKFYMGETGLGILYLFFSWTGIPAIIGFIECFLMPGRIRTYNAMQAQIIVSGIMSAGGAGQTTSSTSVGRYASTSSLTPAMCPSCGESVGSGAAFCAKCGAGVAAAV